MFRFYMYRFYDIGRLIIFVNKKHIKMKDYFNGLRRHYYKMFKNVIKFIFWIPSKLMDFAKNTVGYIIFIIFILFFAILNEITEIILNISFDSTIQKILNDVDGDGSFMDNGDYFTDKTMYALDCLFRKIDKCFE